MRFVRAAIPWLLAIALIAGAALGIGWFLKTIAGWIATQDSEIAAASIAFLGTVIAGIGAVVVSQQRSKSREIAEAHRERKIQLYILFINETIGLMRDTPDFEADPEALERLGAFFWDFTSQLLLWGSPGVLSAYGTFRRGGESAEVILLVDDVLQAMRKDLGLSNWALQRGDLVKMLITDPDELDKALGGK